MKMKSVRRGIAVLCLLCILAACEREAVPAAEADMRATPEADGRPASADTAPVPAPGPADVERFPLEREDREKIIAECMALAELCSEQMENGQTAPSEYFPYDTVLARETVDALEELLAAAGYAVLDTDGTYPEYLRNSGNLKSFAERAGAGAARQPIVGVTRYRSLGYSVFERREEGLRHIFASVSWDENGTLAISEPYWEDVRDWGLAGEEFFYYRVYPFDRHWDACVPLRLSPADRELFGLCAKYIMPLGYQGTNAFLTDWSAADWGGLSFNDVFEYLYLMRWGAHADADSFEYSAQPGCCLVPSELFEETILPYFDISAEELRSRAMYIPGSDAYPWRPVISTEIKYFPTLTPEVRERRENADGSLTLTVDALCFDEKCFPLFTHELTVREDGNGSFKYLGNELVFVGEHSLPDAGARLDRR